MSVDMNDYEAGFGGGRTWRLGYSSEGLITSVEGGGDVGTGGGGLGDGGGGGGRGGGGGADGLGDILGGLLGRGGG